MADTQWSLGRLEDFVKEKALHYIREGYDIKRWEAENPKNAKIRKKVLSELEQKLLSPQFPEKKVTQFRLYKCGWKISDVFAYQLESDYAKEKDVYGCYLLIQKVDEYIYHPGHIIPIVYAKITKNEKLPTSAKEYDSLEYIQTSFRQFNPFVEEFHIDSKNITEEEFQKKVEKRRSKLEFDDFGLLPEYQLKLISTSSRVLPKKLVFIGNFPQINPPLNEFVPRNKIELPSTQWKDLEKTIIDSYYGNNLRQYQIYQKL